ncbi:hypothetical protein BH23CHL8_BH23CHL8_11260 [soil metagenome]
MHQVAMGGDFHPLWDLRVEHVVDGSGWHVTGACDHASDGEACFEALERGQAS